MLVLPALANSPGEVTIAPNVSLRLHGIAVAQELRTDYYIGAIYLPEWSADVAQAAEETVPKRMSMKVLADRLSAREFQRHWKERIALNNPRTVWQPQGERILKFAAAFQEPLQRGDQIDFDFLPGQGTRIRMNDQVLTTISGDGFYALLLSAWLGDIPPTKAFQAALLGGQDAETRARLTLNFDAIPMTKRALATAAAPSVAVVAAAPAVVTAPAPAKATAAKKREAIVAATPPPVSTAKAKVTDASAAATPVVETPAATAVAAVAAPPVMEPVVVAVVEPAPPEVDEDLLLGAYKRDALQKIRKQLEYPARAWRLGLTGSGTIRARIGRAGELLASEIVVSTGQMILDQAMTNMVQRSLPLAALPSELTVTELTLEIPVDFVR